MMAEGGERERAGDSLEAALPLPVPRRAVHRQDRRTFRLQGLRSIHSFQVSTSISLKLLVTFFLC